MTIKKPDVKPESYKYFDVRSEGYIKGNQRQFLWHVAQGGKINQRLKFPKAMTLAIAKALE